MKKSTLHPIKKRKVQRSHDNRYPDCRLYVTCSKQIQSKINKGGCVWNLWGVLGLHKWKLRCIFVIFKTHFLCDICFLPECCAKNSSIVSKGQKSIHCRWNGLDNVFHFCSFIAFPKCPYRSITFWCFLNAPHLRDTHAYSLANFLRGTFYIP